MDRIVSSVRSYALENLSICAEIEGHVSLSTTRSLTTTDRCVNGHSAITEPSLRTSFAALASHYQYCLAAGHTDVRKIVMEGGGGLAFCPLGGFWSFRWALLFGICSVWWATRVMAVSRRTRQDR